MGMWVNYLVNYSTRTEKDVRDVMKDVQNNIKHDENKNARDKLKSLGDVFIDARSVSIQESVFRTTDLPIKFSSPRVIFVPSDMPDQRQGMLKSAVIWKIFLKILMTYLQKGTLNVIHKGLIL